jgi:hypothetical protein
MNKLTKIIKDVLSSYPKKDCGCGCHGKCATNAPMLNENLGAKVIMTENMKYHIDNKKPLIENTFRYGSKAFLDLWAEARYLYSRDAINLSESDKQIILETHLGERGLFNGELVPLDLPMEDLEESQMLDGYEVEYFHTKANVYANIEIPSENPTFEDDIQIKGTGKTEEEAFVDLKQNYEKYKKGTYIDLEENTDEVVAVLNNPNIEDDVKSMLFNAYKNGQLTSTQVINIVKKTVKEHLNEAEFKGKEVQLGKPKRGGSKKFYVYVRDPKTKKIKKVSFGDTTGLSAKINNPKARKAFAARHKCGTGEPKTSAKYWSCRLPRYASLLGLKNSFSGYW